MKYGPPRGMRDFYPEEMKQRTWLFNLWRRAAQQHGFEEYDAPVVETEELLTRKSGEEIVHQIYTFKDKSGRALALRPEMTPSLARMIIAKQNALSFPVRWFSIPQCFRYERMTRGRKREHFQWNMDIIGEESVIAEAEILSTAITALRGAGLTEADLKIHVGDRNLLEALFQASGIPTDHFRSVCLALDKRDKISEEEMVKLLEGEKLDKEAIDKVFRLVAVSTLDEARSFLKEPAALEDLDSLFSLMDQYGLGGWLTFDLSIIRGLDYYTGIVFEGFDTERKLRAIFGGGRYDNLLSTLGGREVPSVGFGFGDVVICELLDHLGRGIGDEGRVDAFIGYMSGEERPLAIQGAKALRESGRTVTLQLQPQKPKKLFSSASKAGARYALYIGASEREEGVLSIKNLDTGDQLTAPPEKLVEKIGKK